MRIHFLIFTLIFTVTFTQAQKSKVAFSKLSGQERVWVILHPFIANKVRKLTNEAITVSNEMKTDTTLDGDPSGGQVDAFRHGYWMALLSMKICWHKALSLGKAHEKGSFKKYKRGITDDEGNRPDSVFGEMDLFNNKIGAIIGCNNKDIHKDSIRIIVKNAVLSGQMKIISKNAQGKALDSLGNAIDFSSIENYWKAPKFLIRSDKVLKTVFQKK